MEITGNRAILGLGLDSKLLSSKSQESNSPTNFLDYLSDALREVDKYQKEAEINAQKLALGDQDYLHNTVIAYEKANLALQFTVEIRNRLVEAYQEIMRIQM
ncbi:MAG: flagellar hook-basal body complex protein FliE [Syntrophomonadaceae bacterium]|nr:flagellar hook-basal body complex protein FliE [Syntrophomonadaceae bacterium]